MTEVIDPKPEQDEAHDSGTDSDDAESIPDLEETGGEGSAAADAVAAAAGLNEEGVSKNKQSRGEKKARKIMSKLGLKQVSEFWYYIPTFMELIRNYKSLRLIT